MFGYDYEEDSFMPRKVRGLLLSSSEFAPNCTCKKCNSRKCICPASQIPCCKLCGCGKNDECNNNNNN